MGPSPQQSARPCGSDVTSTGDRRGSDLLGWVMAPVGLVLVAGGLSVSIDAAVRRAGGAPLRRWVGQGTVGLVVFNSGLSVFGDAVRRRAVSGGQVSGGQVAEPGRREPGQR